MFNNGYFAFFFYSIESKTRCSDSEKRFSNESSRKRDDRKYWMKGSSIDVCFKLLFKHCVIYFRTLENVQEFVIRTDVNQEEKFWRWNRSTNYERNSWEIFINFRFCWLWKLKHLHFYARQKNDLNKNQRSSIRRNDFFTWKTTQNFELERCAFDLRRGIKKDQVLLLTVNLIENRTGRTVVLLNGRIEFLFCSFDRIFI